MPNPKEKDQLKNFEEKIYEISGLTRLRKFPPTLKPQTLDEDEVKVAKKWINLNKKNRKS